MRVLLDGLIQAAREIRSNLFRSLLTLLGVVLGVAALVGMIGVLESMVRGMEAFNNTKGGLAKISVRPQAVPENQRYREKLSPGRTLRDVAALRGAHLVKNVSPEVNISWFPVDHRGRVDWANVQGVTPAVTLLYDFNVEQGRFISDLDSAQVASVCVLGAGIAAQLFDPGEPMLGRRVRIGVHPFRVVGVTPRYESRQGGRNALWRRNWSVWIPITTGQKRFTGSRRIDELNMQAVSLPAMAPAMEEVENILRPLHRDVRDFHVENQLGAMMDFARQQRRLRLSLASVAGLSLLIGGIGIMSVMLTGVNERVREIGVRKALGAHGGDIFAQFLFEAVALAVAGGVGGLAAGTGLVHALAYVLPQQPPVLVPSALVIGAIASVATGVLAGVYPALRAAALDPIEALRCE